MRITGSIRTALLCFLLTVAYKPSRALEAPIDSGGMVEDVLFWDTGDFNLISNPNRTILFLNESLSDWPNLKLVYTKWQSALQYSTVTLPIDFRTTEHVLIQIMSRAIPKDKAAASLSRMYPISDVLPVRVVVDDKLSQKTELKTVAFKMSSDTLWKIYSFTVPIEGSVKIIHNAAFLQKFYSAVQTYIEVYTAGEANRTLSTTTVVPTTLPINATSTVITWQNVTSAIGMMQNATGLRRNWTHTDRNVTNVPNSIVTLTKQTSTKALPADAKTGSTALTTTKTTTIASKFLPIVDNLTTAKSRAASPVVTSKAVVATSPIAYDTTTAKLLPTTVKATSTVTTTVVPTKLAVSTSTTTKIATTLPTTITTTTTTIPSTVPTMVTTTTTSVPSTVPMTVTTTTTSVPSTVAPTTAARSTYKVTSSSALSTTASSSTPSIIATMLLVESSATPTSPRLGPTPVTGKIITAIKSTPLHMTFVDDIGTNLTVEQQGPLGDLLEHWLQFLRQNKPFTLETFPTTQPLPATTTASEITKPPVMDQNYAMAKFIESLIGALGSSTQTTTPCPNVATLMTKPTTTTTTETATTLPTTTRGTTASRKTTPTQPYWEWTWTPPTWATGQAESATPQPVLPTLPVIYARLQPGSRLSNSLWPPLLPAVRLPPGLRPLSGEGVYVGSQGSFYPHRPAWTKSVLQEDGNGLGVTALPIIKPGEPNNFYVRHKVSKHIADVNGNAHALTGDQFGGVDASYSSSSPNSLSEQQQVSARLINALAPSRRSGLVAKLRITALVVLFCGFALLAISLAIIVNKECLKASEIVALLRTCVDSWLFDDDGDDDKADTDESKMRHPRLRAVSTVGALGTAALVAIVFSDVVVLSAANDQPLWQPTRLSTALISGFVLVIGLSTYVATHVLVLVQPPKDDKNNEVDA